jgi:YspA, cpYpsA-related SLOG family
MRVLVCGSRSWQDIHAIRRRLIDLPAHSTIIHGAAPVADTIAALLADDLGFSVRGYHANWRRDGKRAGILRNLRMLDSEPDLVIAFWDRESRGTKHVIDEARRRGITVDIVRPVGTGARRAVRDYGGALDRLADS